MKYIIALLLVTTTLGGCAGHRQWTRMGATAADVEHAKLECEYEATKSEHEYHGIVGAAAEGMRLGNLQVMCMRVKGFELS